MKKTTLLSILIPALLLHMTVLRAAGQAELVRAVNESGFKGGVIVLVGCDDGEELACLRVNERFIVQGVTTNEESLGRIRKYLAGEELSGEVSAVLYDKGRLPYGDNIVNVLIVKEDADVSREEINRVLAPRGVVISGRKVEYKKPYPEDMDEWTHFLHGPDGNAVAEDTHVGPPRHIQWKAPPKWIRAHRTIASVSNYVTEDGKIYHILDEGLRASIRLPSRWVVEARDAFNGTLLWKRPMSGFVDQFRKFRHAPASSLRRMVAYGGRLYVTLGYFAPVTVLDGDTGEILATLEETTYTRDLIVCRDKLIAYVDKNMKEAGQVSMIKQRYKNYKPGDHQLEAVNLKTHKIDWRIPLPAPAFPSMCTDGEHLIIQTEEKLMAFDFDTGEKSWQTPVEAKVSKHSWVSTTAVIKNGLVYVGDGVRLQAFDAATGEKKWETKTAFNFFNPPDIFIADNLLWTGKNNKRNDPDYHTGYDPATGEPKRKIDTTRAFTKQRMGHHRCYRDKATEKYIIVGRTGAEFIDIRNNDVNRNDFVRGTCQYGVMPANGLLYKPPDPCTCQVNSKLNGMYALYHKRQKPLTPVPDNRRLVKGPAYDDRFDKPTQDDDWPTYRGDAARSGSVDTAISATSEKWTLELDAELTPSAAAYGKLFVAAKNEYTVYAIDAGEGEVLWRFTAGGKIDSPPTIYEGKVYFGSYDGNIYCLRAGDGALAWRFLAAPQRWMIGDDGRLASSWPVNGSVVIYKGKLYAAAGRSSYLDGGVLLYCLDPQTGKILAKEKVCHRDPHTGREPFGDDFMPGLLTDILSANEDGVYIRQHRFDFDCKPLNRSADHLFSPYEYLGTEWFVRTYWSYGSDVGQGWQGWAGAGRRAPAGRIMVFDDEDIYGYGRDRYKGGNNLQWSLGDFYRLYAHNRKGDGNVVNSDGEKLYKHGKGGESKPNWGHKYCPKLGYRWIKRHPIIVRAMALAEETLFVAGIPDVARPSPKSAIHLQNADEAQAAWEGEKGGLLWGVNTSDGTARTKIRLTSPPIFDGLIAARGRLYVALKDGSITCVGK